MGSDLLDVVGGDPSGSDSSSTEEEDEEEELTSFSSVVFEYVFFVSSSENGFLILVAKTLTFELVDPGLDLASGLSGDLET